MGVGSSWKHNRSSTRASLVPAAATQHESALCGAKSIGALMNVATGGTIYPPCSMSDLVIHGAWVVAHRAGEFLCLESHVAFRRPQRMCIEILSRHNSDS